MAAITLGGLVLSWGGRLEVGVPWGALAIAGACLAWGIDNNLTRRVSAGDPVQIAALKGLVAGGVNLTIAFSTGAHLPSFITVTMAGLLGFFGYGVSLTLFRLSASPYWHGENRRVFFAGAVRRCPHLGCDSAR
jgi:hypothetical protein